jgi:hypothetical protein
MPLDRNVRLAGSDQVGVTVGELIDEIAGEAAKQAMAQVEQAVLGELRKVLADATAAQPGARPT